MIGCVNMLRRNAELKAKMKQRGAVIPETKAGRELNKELANMRQRKATVEDGWASSLRLTEISELQCCWQFLEG